MHVMFVDMNMDKWLDHDSNVVHEIVRVDVSLVSWPTPCSTRYDRSYVCPLKCPRYDTAFTLWLVEGPDLKLRFAVVWVTAASDEVE